jgi:hypothetical protein
MKLKIEEVVQLNYELNGMVLSKENGEQEEFSKGLLKQKTSMKNKVLIQRLNKVVQEEVKLFEDAKKELYQSFGEEKNGQITIPAEKIEEFNKEFKELLSMEIDVNLNTLWTSPITLEDLSSIETEEVYPIFIQLIDNQA